MFPDGFLAVLRAEGMNGFGLCVFTVEPFYGYCTYLVCTLSVTMDQGL